MTKTDDSPAPHEGLRAALEKIGAQLLPEEMEDDGLPNTPDYEGGYIELVKIARAALQSAPVPSGEDAALAGERTITIGTREHLAALRYATQGGMFEFDTEKRRLIDEVRALLEMTGPITRGLGITEGGFPLHPVPDGATP